MFGYEFKEMKQISSCQDGDDIQRLGFNFTGTFDLNSDNIFFKHNFRCNYNKCNDKHLVNNLLQLFYEEYKIKSFLTMFGDTIENEEETTTDSTQSSMFSTSQEQTNSITSTSITNSHMNQSVKRPCEPTTQANNGLHLQSANAIVLMIFLSRFIFLA
jgi:hypothetical protein